MEMKHLQVLHNAQNQSSKWLGIFLQSFVHISTAFSNSDKDQVEEVVYKPAYDPYDVINCVEILPPEGIELLAKEILVRRSNLRLIRG